MDNVKPRTSPLRGLLVLQFVAIFIDNAWKLAVVLLGIAAVSTRMGGPSASSEAMYQEQTALAFIVYTVPLMIVSPAAGILSDRWSKRTILVAMKLVEVALMVVATVVLLYGPEDTLALMMILGLLGVRAAVLSPAKYGIVPEIVPHERLSDANGRLELYTFVAIVAGTGLAGPMLDATGGALWVMGIVLTLVAIVGLVGALAVPGVPATHYSAGMFVSIAGAWRQIWADRILWLAVVGAVFFWWTASLASQEILIYAKVHLRLSNSMSGIPLAVLAGGVGVGAMLAARLSGDRVEYGLIPLGALGIALFALLLGVVKPGLWGTLIVMVCLGVSSGLFTVPINALIQWRAPDDQRGSVIAVSNTFIFGALIVGSLSSHLFSQLGLSAAAIFVVAGLVTLGGTVWALWLLPLAFLRLLLILLANTFYRVTVRGPQNIPASGGALLAPNHVSFADGLFLIISMDRPIRFVVAQEIFEKRWVKPFLEAMRAVPIPSTGGPRGVLRALRAAGQNLDNGEVVCLFPEGQITRTGMLLPFRRGFERILTGRTAPVIPVHLDRVWGSIFSYSSGRFFSKLPERLPYPVTVTFGRAMSAGATAEEVREVVQRLGEEAWQHRKEDIHPLHVRLFRAMRRHPFRLAFADLTRPRVSCAAALAGTVIVARRLVQEWNAQQFVGILLPPSVGGALVNQAASLSGRTSVNLNYTTGRAGIEAAARQAGLRTIVTSRQFVAKAGLELPDGVEILWLEDLVSSVGRLEQVTAFLLGLFCPVRWLEKRFAARRIRMDDPATVIFSSGSTGEPKGVVLSHFNIGSNVEAINQVLPRARNDRLLGILPFFHSFGFTALWIAANRGMGIAFHPTPLDPVAIGDLVRRYRITFLIATPTFLQLYLRRCSPEQFGSLRVVIAGAEKMSDRLAQAFEDRFGVRPLEAYGATECSPGIAMNLPGFRAPGLVQQGARRGSVGQPLPGVAVQVVDPDTFEPLPFGRQGMLLVKGPNVMQGYLGRDDLTASVMRDNWYITGDIAMVDEDGFISLTDRLSRFSKIGGEMVPHGRVEEALHAAVGADTQVFAVTGVPDERRGEMLAVLYTCAETDIPGVLDKAAANGLPNLYLPRPDHFIRVESLPLLGTGKLDLRAVKAVALAALGKSPAGAMASS